MGRIFRFIRRDAKAHRSPPEAWEETVAKLAKERLARYRALIERLTHDGGGIDAASTHHP
jgi:hypothetical protein